MNSKKPFKNNSINHNRNNTKLLELRVPCDPANRGVVIGKKGAIKFGIIKETGVKEIIVPSADQDKDIIIKSYDRESLYHAKKLILNLIKAGQIKNPDVETNFLKRNTSTSTASTTSKSPTTKATTITKPVNTKSLLEIQIPCDVAYRGAIIGKKGATKYKIIQDTGVEEIIIPSNSHSKNIIVKGYDEESLQHAKDTIMKIIEDIEDKKSKEATHFLSLPLIDPNFLSKVDHFYNEWMELSTDKDFLTNMMMPTTCLHLTIATLNLKDENEIKKATELMKSLSSQICDMLNTQPLSLKMKGLAIMKGTIENARVIYIEVQKEQSYTTIMHASKYLIEQFRKAGIHVRESEDKSITFHATILNTKKYTKDKVMKSTYDATQLFEQFGNTDFGDTQLNNFSLCVIGTRNPKTGYKCLEKITFSK